MDISALNQSTEDAAWFYPELGNNREKPVEERAGMLCTLLSGREIQMINRSLQKKAISKAKTKSLAAIYSMEQQKREKLVLTHVKELKNWFLVDKDSQKKEIKDIGELINVLLDKWRNASEAQGFVDQIYEFIVGESSLDEELEGE